MYLWVPLIVAGMIKVACALIDWRARMAYERARAAAVAEILRTAPGVIRLRDKRADGTVLDIEIPAPALPDQATERLPADPGFLGGPC